jgi:hypothetical protein
VKAGDIIFLSASVPHREEWVEGSRPSEIEEAIISIARAVFARGGRLLFGGHPSVSPLVSAVAGEYFPPNPARTVRPVVTFQSEVFKDRLPDKTTEMVRMGWSAIEWTHVEPGSNDKQTQKLSLKLMRQEMLSPLGSRAEREMPQVPRAMITVGGMEGIGDEALAFVQRREQWDAPSPRIFSFRSGGGAAAKLLQPSMEGLWPKPEDRPAPVDFEKLREAWMNGDVVDVEAEWRRHFEPPPDMPFQPYAAMVQWLLDTQLERPRPH